MTAAFLRLPFGLSRMHSHTWWAIGFVTAFALVWWAIAAWREHWHTHRTRSWPVVPGTIDTVRTAYSDGGADGASYWRLSFKYRYRVTSEHRGSYTLNLATQALRDRAVAGLEGKTVPVHYHPAREDEGLLWEDEVWALW